MACSTLQKMILMPGCRPWDTPDPVQASTDYQFHLPGVTAQVPYRLPDLPTGEFALVEDVKVGVSKAVKNLSRLVSSTSSPTQQGEAPAWYDIGAKLSAGASAANDALQSTLIKVIVLVTIVGALALFGMSYVQSKGVQLAK